MVSLPGRYSTSDTELYLPAPPSHVPRSWSDDLAIVKAKRLIKRLETERDPLIPSKRRRLSFDEKKVSILTHPKERPSPLPETRVLISEVVTEHGPEKSLSIDLIFHSIDDLATFTPTTDALKRVCKCHLLLSPPRAANTEFCLRISSLVTTSKPMLETLYTDYPELASPLKRQVEEQLSRAP